MLRAYGCVRGGDRLLVLAPGAGAGAGCWVPLLVLVLGAGRRRGCWCCELAVHVAETGCWRWCLCRVAVLVLGAGAGAGGVACICEGVYFRIFFQDGEAMGFLLQ